MEKKTNLFVPTAIVLAILLIVSAYLAFTMLDLEKQLKQTTSNLEQTNKQLSEEQKKSGLLENQLDKINSELSYTKDDLYSAKSKLALTETKLSQTDNELNKTKKELNETTKNLAEIKNEFVILNQEITQLNETLTQSIQWFRENSILPTIPDFGNDLRELWYEGFLNNVNLECIIEEGNSRTFKLACVPFVMEKTLSFRYKSEEPDKLYSIKEMVLKEGGDCEDFSLFLKGLINMLKENPKNQNTIIEAVTISKGTEYSIYGDPSKGEEYWYMEDATGMKLSKLNEIYPYSVCYMMSEYEGHCIVALAWDKINETKDILILDEGILFEPQNGQYKGRIGTTLMLCKDGQELCGRTSNSIMMIITDDDLYQFQEGEWKGYKRYKQEIETILKKVGATNLE